MIPEDQINFPVGTAEVRGEKLQSGTAQIATRRSFPQSSDTEMFRFGFEEGGKEFPKQFQSRKRSGSGGFSGANDRR